MNPEQLRQLYIADCDYAIAHPWVIGRERVARAEAMRTYLKQMTAEDLQKLGGLQSAPAAAQEPDGGRLLAVARVVIKEFEASNDARSPTPNLWPALELLREQVESAA